MARDTPARAAARRRVAAISALAQRWVHQCQPSSRLRARLGQCRRGAGDRETARLERSSSSTVHAKHPEQKVLCVDVVVSEPERGMKCRLERGSAVAIKSQSVQSIHTGVPSGLWRRQGKAQARGEVAIRDIGRVDDPGGKAVRLAQEPEGQMVVTDPRHTGQLGELTGRCDDVPGEFCHP